MTIKYKAPIYHPYNVVNVLNIACKVTNLFLQTDL